ncbi:glycerol-3-phosphate dehydrogenase/oxidase [Urbifossiella limnaea]|uniref:Glycerol-3-phosphate dehydrogenase n=1 Tax=Urbifossiella limnaea TaxID=2528023 RepID=A0A517Y2B0_9BACT|nr:glycerol-3-phosphate dehydrogenase/oxidase [Urbifossiella limnaea]QDU23897.1 Aerobic glycerol-3-phosphate dehydrogenase [Urbifossiella limnaea]
MTRADMLARAADRRDPWDVVVVGGGATGAGVAVDAAARGYSVLLLERADFGSGTSSRSTKLVHGGVRYLRQGNLGLVTGALRERGRLRRNAPHLVHDLRFVLPCYRRLDLLKFGAGLTAYDLLAGRERFGRSKLLSAGRVSRLLPTVRTGGLRGGVLYHDGQFDDARLLIALIRTAADRGAVVLNQAPVTELLSHQGHVRGLMFHDAETGTQVRAAARVVVNAAGPFCDEVRRLADPATAPLLAASQGSHVVLPRRFLPTDHALLIPETPDGRVLFAIPWHGHTVVGTTDVPIPAAPTDPTASDAEIDFILETAGRYLATPPTRADVLATFAGVRPLVKGDAASTAGLSRDHVIRTDQPGLVTITGGKWTTYRAMAEECVDVAARLANLPPRPCPTAELRLHGAADVDATDEYSGYGSDASAVRAIVESDAALRERLHPDLPYRAGEVLWAARHEMARTADDVLFRRLRAGALNAAATAAMRPRVEALLREA